MPEPAVLGIGLVADQGVSVALLVAIFASNLPEAIGPAADVRSAGTRARAIILGWSVVAVVCTLATFGGDGISTLVGDPFAGVVGGFAAGALLVMLVSSMIPEATEKADKAAALFAVLGFAVAAGLSAVRRESPLLDPGRNSVCGDYLQNAIIP